MNRHFSPLRYPGGKARLARYIHSVFEKNLLVDGCYVEPFAGGAAVGLSVLFLEFASRIYLNDIDKSVYSFWKAVLNHPEELCKTIHDRKATVSEWKRQRAISLTPSGHGIVELGFSTFFLNRTSRSGIIEGSGPIGGFDQKGNYKIDARYNKSNLIERIQTIAQYKNRISLSNDDAEVFLRNICSELPEQSLIYLDPPYYLQGSALYTNYYEPKDHARLARFVQNRIKQRWMVSYDDVPSVRRLYSGTKQLPYKFPYSAARRYVGGEVLFFSKNLAVPKNRDPLHAN